MPPPPFPREKIMEFKQICKFERETDIADIEIIINTKVSFHSNTNSKKAVAVGDIKKNRCEHSFVGWCVHIHLHFVFPPVYFGKWRDRACVPITHMRLTGNKLRVCMNICDGPNSSSFDANTPIDERQIII